MKVCLLDMYNMFITVNDAAEGLIFIKRLLFTSRGRCFFQEWSSTDTREDMRLKVTQSFLTDRLEAKSSNNSNNSNNYE